MAKQLVSIPSETTRSNAAISDFLQSWLQEHGFTVERLSYVDALGEEKVNLIAKLGNGKGGLGFFSHSDTVHGDPCGWNPFDPVIQQDKLIGRGCCDMKGPLAATLIAAATAAHGQLSKPVYLVTTADEENGHVGARYIIEHSALLEDNWPENAIVAEPTGMVPVYAHKGGALITVTAHGKAAHTSTEKGVSANFIIAPFLADMAALVPVFRNTERFKNHEFNPPTNGFNMTIDDGNCRPNVTAAKTVVRLSLRLMPNDHHDEQMAMIEDKAKAYGLEVEHRILEPFYISPDAEVIQTACRVTGIPKAVTVSYGTEAEAYQKFTEPVILGPGSIEQAHTKGEWIDIEQLQKAVAVFSKMIELLCK
ncbi:MAG: M20/M25/M40 family metallo-hydrolase [Deltaproteobacteria bacterium]|nr:M20/M25/M40 family metallo-hydrolase [Deltaproteobacteria bacterium]MBW1962270.1 M20/M25/M40 family metallo-hydrolase [Deltaproteobacteria bacterium]MBW2153823.1 M20/M25/M40 family metallo-hydrolase [Deltaproteobacteria bacterium]